MSYCSQHIQVLAPNNLDRKYLIVIVFSTTLNIILALLLFCKFISELISVIMNYQFTFFIFYWGGEKLAVSWLLLLFSILVAALLKNKANSIIFFLFIIILLKLNSVIII